VSAEPESLEQRLGYQFRRQELLDLALIHRSSASRSGSNNEKLEFLGDAALDLAVSDVLMERFPKADEGELSKRRAALVNARVLAEQAVKLELGQRLRLGKGEEKSGGRRKASILAGAYEAVLGAVYLDGGIAPVREIVSRHFAAELSGASSASTIDPKSRLQEVTQRVFRATPAYALVEASGPEHDRAFVSELRVAGKVYGRGCGKTKKDAEQQAALQALAVLGETKGERKSAAAASTEGPQRRPLE
jgi:ribonuclease-3